MNRFPSKPLLAATLLLSFGTSHGDDLVRQLDGLSRQWLMTEQQASHIEQSWRQQKPVLEQRISLLKAEKSELSEVIKRSKTSSNDVDEQRIALLEKQTQVEQDQARITEVTQSLKSRLDGYFSMLPPPLQQDWMNDDEVEPSELLRRQLARLSRLEEFNDRLTVVSARLPAATVGAASGSDDVLVKQLYLGLAQAWFVSADGSYSGVGRVVDGEWQWLQDPAIDPQAVLAAIDAANSQVPTEPVSLPLALSDSLNMGQDATTITTTEGE